MSFATDYMTEGQPGSITPRGVFVPPWYKPHSDVTVMVKSHDGKRTLGFTIADVAVERRWAIDAEGCVMEGHDFKAKLEEWYIGQWQWQNPPQRPLEVDAMAYPHPEMYVAKGPDPSNVRRLISLQPPVDRRDFTPSERPVNTEQLRRTGWSPAPKKDS